MDTGTDTLAAIETKTDMNMVILVQIETEMKTHTEMDTENVIEMDTEIKPDN